MLNNILRYYGMLLFLAILIEIYIIYIYVYIYIYSYNLYNLLKYINEFIKRLILLNIISFLVL